MTVQQVGGTHYGGHINQHWDLVARWDLEYLPATATAYVMRWDRKGSPVEDLEKAVSYLEKQLEIIEGLDPGWRLRVVPSHAMDQFYRDNDIMSIRMFDAEKRLILWLVHVEGTEMTIRLAIKHLSDMLTRERDKP